MFIGIDIGTSSVKGLLVDGDQRVVAETSAPLTVSRPRPLWSEQDPEHWWQATGQVLAGLRDAAPRGLAGVRALGLSGQMHGATLLDVGDAPLRPAILWNDGRSVEQCRRLHARVPELAAITGNRAMAGFTAPKLLWVAEHEPELHARLRSVLLPKDYVRLRLTGERVGEMSDAAGTLWLDVGARRWSGALAEASELPASALPRLVEGSEASATLRPEIAERFGLPRGLPVAGGAGDNAAGAIGVGVLDAGQGFVSLGTSGVYFTASDRYAPNPEGGVHTFCHALPGRWHQMGVLLSAASCLSWHAGVHGRELESLLAEAWAAEPDGTFFLPYLAGERTPHDDPGARGVFFGMGHGTTRAQLTHAVLEGVAFALVDAQRSLLAAGARPEALSLIGGGARSEPWARLIASALGRPLSIRRDAERGAAFGAARLARLSVTGEPPAEVCVPGELLAQVEPDAALAERCAARLPTFRALYARLRDLFPQLQQPPAAPSQERADA